jgi:hypothetical protein
LGVTERQEVVHGCGPRCSENERHDQKRAEQRLKDEAQSAFDEFQILRFRATNAKPFPFEWVDLSKTEME